MGKEISENLLGLLNKDNMKKSIDGQLRKN